ncbi:beta-lactamase hydrolase domain-containing protein [Aliikangiella sp. IMCC44632]
MKNKTAILIIVLLFSCFTMANEPSNLKSIEIKNLNTLSDSIITAGQPSQQAIKSFATSGVKTIINLRTPGEFNDFDEKKIVETEGMEYIQLPISGASDINLENAQKLDELLQTAKGPVLIHCASSNRVGALLAIRAAAVQSKSLQEAISIGESTGLGSLKEHTQSVIKSIKK